MGKFHRRREGVSSTFVSKGAKLTKASLVLTKFCVVKLLDTGKLIPVSPNLSIKEAIPVLKKTKNEQFRLHQNNSDYHSYDIVDAWICKFSGECPHKTFLNGKSCKDLVDGDKPKSRICKHQKCGKTFDVPLATPYKVFCTAKCASLHHGTLARERNQSNSPLKIQERNCAFCLKPFIPFRIRELNCSKDCSQQLFLKRKLEKTKAIATTIHSLMVDRWRQSNEPVSTYELLDAMRRTHGIKSLRAYMHSGAGKFWNQVKSGLYIPVENSNAQC